MCPECPNCPDGSARVVRNGHFYRASDARKIQKFVCRSCQRSFSSATFSDCFRQKKRRINPAVREMLSRGMCLRDIAATVGVTRTTIARRLVFLGEQSRRQNQAVLAEAFNDIGPPEYTQFDDLITSEHTKCKPVSCGVMVHEETRFILGYTSSQIPAFGHLAAISREKYGHRSDHSRKDRHRLFEDLSDQYPEVMCIRTDKHKHYPVVIKKYFPNAIHQTYKGKSSGVQGQGEMKATRRDPLFWINQTLAMLRAKISRLQRRSWNLSKSIPHLNHHLAIYIEAHNRRIWEKLKRERANSALRKMVA